MAAFRPLRIFGVGFFVATRPAEPGVYQKNLVGLPGGVTFEYTLTKNKP